MAEIESIVAVTKPEPIHATLRNGESASAAVEVRRETPEVAISMSTSAGTYNLMLSSEGAIDLALRIISVVGRLRKLDRPTD